MKRQTLKAIGGASLAIWVLAVFAQVRVPAQVHKGNEQGLVGSWDVTVTIRDCQTGDPIPFIPIFPAMVTYNQGGTMQESDLGAPGLVHLLGHGVWEHQNGRRYSAAFRDLLFNDRTFVGTNVVREAITLGPGGDTYTATATFELLDANGEVIPGAGGCGTETATRFK